MFSLSVLLYYFCLPKSLFNDETSTVVLASNKELLGAVIAKDGQWRFPELDTVPEKFKTCLLEFEDAYFYQHFGFNPVSIGNAFIENVKAGRVVRGGSTLTQQVIRLSRKHKNRSYFEKLKELIWATRLEFRETKEEILNLYASHAPFGGNVVGLEMASWRYFGLQPSQLSWAESATLAVLPNAPSLIYPGKNQSALKYKRDRLLKKIFKKGYIDSLSYTLAIEEALPRKPFPLPEIAPHFVQKVAKDYRGKKTISSLNYRYQNQINQLVKQHYDQLKQNQVFNASVLVLDVKTRKVLAYIGNSPTDAEHQKDVDNIMSLRSTGSTLKPMLYAQMLQTGDLLPTQLVADIPTEISGYTPKNFNLSFDGAVPADQALTRSLNIPAVRLLRYYGLEKFRTDLIDYNIASINKSSDYYGLALILGGAEACLWDLSKVFAGYSSIINHYNTTQRYFNHEFVDPSFLHDDKVSFGKASRLETHINAGVVYLTLDALTEVNRPVYDQAWKYYESAQKIAWKTGTSFGNKDAWAIGTNSDYVVGVWIGNSDGEGRSDLTGVGSAAPLLFDTFDLLPKSNWFVEPIDELIEEKICIKSGCLALPICEFELKKIPKNGVRGKSCSYHTTLLVDCKEEYRVNADCAALTQIKSKTWFVLPPLQAYFYKQRNSEYKPVPNYRPDCLELEPKTMDFVFPTGLRSKFSLTKNESGNLNTIVFKVAHSDKNASVYWYLNDEYMGKTKEYHELAMIPRKGQHSIIAIDNYGNEVKRYLEIN